MNLERNTLPLPSHWNHYCGLSQVASVTFNWLLTAVLTGAASDSWGGLAALGLAKVFLALSLMFVHQTESQRSGITAGS